ncbi:hypothetical protein FTO74_14420 [Granulicella sp. WH15]|uniref:phage tail tube protein n=1 Tax=Granulicella sp. WH15 TaxID=2602070 RepID=UPI001366B59B|nr:phage tail tube protein [Granulicella sp. WH15]QHN04427.1 hypothetical protein FTO74_14420 [Granulicella sp. WH15]
MSINLQKQSSRNLVLSANTQAAYGGVLADAALTVRQRFDPSSAISATPGNRTDKESSGKGTEWATDDQITSWDTAGTIKNDADTFLLGWMLSLAFGQETVVGAGPYTHTFTLPSVTATMPATTIYVEETNDVKRKYADMAAKTLSIDVPERGAVSASLDLVGTGKFYPGAMEALPALAQAIYLLGSDVIVTITPAAGAAVPFNGRQKGISIKLDRGSAAYESSGDGLTSGSVASGDGKFSVDLTIAAGAVDDVNGWFESGIRCSLTIATNVALPYRFGFTFPSVRFNANKVTNTNNTVTWALSLDETSSIQVGAQAAISAFVINDTAAFLAPL